MKKIIPFLLIIISLNACSSSKQIIASKNDLDSKLQNTLNYKRVSGFSVSIFTKDKIIYENAFGYADIDSKTPYTLDTEQHIASISKTIIGVALLKAQELGLFTLNDPIGWHLPFKVINPHFKNDAITIRQLATHTSSIKYSEKMTDSISFENPNLSLEEILKAYLTKDGKWYSDDNFHKKKPSTLGDYSNVGASLAAYIIEHKAGIPFSEFTKKYIFKPLGLNKTGFQEEIETNYYKYLSQNNFKKISTEEKGTGLYPAGSLSTNLRELTMFCQMVMNNGSLHNTKILNPESVQKMLETSKLKKSLDDEINKQAIFWSTMKSPLGIPREMIGHNGGDYGIFTMMFFDQKSGIGYILLSNTGMTEENVVSMHNIYKSLWQFTQGKKLMK